MKKAVVFDLDGTLADTAGTLADAMNRVIEEKGAETIEYEKVVSFVGHGIRDLIIKSFTYRNIPLSEEIIEEAIIRFREFYSENATEALPYPGIPKLLEELKEYDLLLGVYSNKPNRFVKPIVDALFGENTFAFALGQTEKPRKPDPTVLLELLTKFGSSPENCIYVGDSDVDVKTAINAGTGLCAVSWGYRSVETLIEAGATFITNNPNVLLQNIKSKLGL